MNHDFEIHSHEFCELFFIVSGRGTHVLNNHEYQVSKGDVFVLKGNEKHGFTQCENLKLFNIMFSLEDFIEDEFRKMPGFWAMFVNEPHFGNPSYQKLVTAHFDRFFTIIQCMHEEYKEKRDGHIQYCRSCLMQVIVILSRCYQPLNESSSFRLGKAIAYIEDNFTEPIELETLALLSNLSIRHFSRLFSQIYANTPVNYILDLRIKYAKELMKNSTLNMTEIALKSGFADSNYFSRAFKKKEGMSPMNYRRKMI